MKKKYNYIAGVMAVVLCQSTIFATPIQLEVNNEVITPTVSPVIEQGTTLVPLRIISEHLGAEVTYVPEGRQITVTKDEAVIKLAIEEKHAVVNGELAELTLAPKLVNDTTMVPVRFVSEALGCQVEWDGELKKISITSSDHEDAIHMATIKIKDRGELVVELYPKIAPITVQNFIELSQKGFYDGLTFHRVIEDFMIQGGCPKGDGTGGPGYSIRGEFASNGFANSISHTPGVLSMARAANPNSGGSQFFIMTSEMPHLDGEYAAFGKVVSGMDIVYDIEKVGTTATDLPVEPIVIETITIKK